MPVKIRTIGGNKYATMLSEKERHKMEHKQHHYNFILENIVWKEKTGKKYIKILPKFAHLRWGYLHTKKRTLKKEYV